LDGKREDVQPISKTFYDSDTTTLQLLHADLKHSRATRTFNKRAYLPSTAKRNTIQDPAMATRTLHGACACGRNRYVIEMPSHELQLAQLLYDNTSASRMCLPKIAPECACALWTSRHTSHTLALQADCSTRTPLRKPNHPLATRATPMVHLSHICPISR
jgi:hypothetical protein